jgi:hypothetical protein
MPLVAEALIGAAMAAATAIASRRLEFFMWSSSQETLFVYLVFTVAFIIFGASFERLHYG